MNPEILKAHALTVQGKMKPEDFDALLIGMIVGDKKVHYSTYIQSVGWKIKAEMAKMRAGYRCQDCGVHRDDGAQLDAHHLTYKRLGHERPEDIAVLCHTCHGLRHGVVR